MAAQGSAIHLDVETEAPQAMPSQDTVPRRMKMIWFLQGMGLAALMLVGVAAMHGFAHEKTPSHDAAAAFVFSPSSLGTRTGGLPSATNVKRMQAKTPVMQVSDRQMEEQLAFEASAGTASLDRRGSQTLDGRGRPRFASTPVQLIQGGSLRTWGYRSPDVDQLQVILSTEGRPLDSDIELWHGPDNTPFKMRVYSEDGRKRPFSAVLETPRGPNTVAIRNIGQMEFPIAANVVHDDIDQPSNEALASSAIVQGGALRTYPFDPMVDSVEILLTTDGRPLNARVELLQGPNNNKQVIELYAEDGRDRRFFAIIDTPGAGNVIRIVNTAPVEFPMSASVVPHSINMAPQGAVMGGDVVIGGDVGF